MSARAATSADAPLGRVVAAVAGIALLAAWDLGGQSLSLDEGVTSVRVTDSPENFREAITQWEPNFALYYLLMRGWAALFGSSDIALRIPSVIFVVGAAPFIYGAVRRLFDHRIALAAMLIYGVNPFVLRQAHDARPYSLVLLLVAAGIYLFVVAMQTGDTRAWLGWTVVGCVALYAHPFTLLATGAQMATWLVHRKGGLTLPRLAISSVAFVLAAVPLLRALLPGGAERIAWIPEADPTQVGTAAVVVSGGTFVWLAIFVTAWAGVAWWWWKERARPVDRTWPYVVLLVGAALPVVTLYVMSHLYVPVFLDRYLLIIVPALAGATGVTLMKLGDTRKVALAAAFVVAVSLVPVGNIYRTEWKVDYRSATTVVADLARPGDGVILFPRGKEAFGHYFSTLGGATGVESYDIEEVSRPDVYDEVIERHDRIWLLINEEDTVGDRQVLMEPFAGWERVEVQDFYRMQLRLMERF